MKIKTLNHICRFTLKNSLSQITLAKLKKKILNNEEEKYFGYLSYELKNNIERFKEINKNYIKIDKLYFSSFHFNLEFNHDKKEIICKFSEDLKDKIS